MRGALVVRNRQRVCRVDLRVLRRIVKAALQEILKEGAFDLGIYLVGAAEMTDLNETFLRHRGPTDVIAFDYSQRAKRGLSSFPAALHGEIFVCVEEAIRQARRFRTTWQSELVRYVLHGMLHLRGFDDSRRRQRQKMKREENRLLRELRREFDFAELRSVSG